MPSAAGVVGGVGDVQVVVLLLVRQRAVGLDLVAVDPVGAAVGDVEQRLVGREGDAVGELQSAVDDLLLALGVDVPDLARLARVPARVGDVDAAVVADDQVVAAEAVGDHGRLAVGVVGQDLARAGRDGVEPAVGAERLAVGLLRVGEERRHLAVEADLVGLAVGDVVEEDLALGVRRRALGELVAFADEAPALAGDQDLLQLLRPAPAFTGAGQSFQSHRIASGKISVACLPLWPPSPQTWLTS